MSDPYPENMEFDFDRKTLFRYYSMRLSSPEPKIDAGKCQRKGMKRVILYPFLRKKPFGTVCM